MTRHQLFSLVFWFRVIFFTYFTNMVDFFPTPEHRLHHQLPEYTGKVFLFLLLLTKRIFFKRHKNTNGLPIFLYRMPHTVTHAVTNTVTHTMHFSNKFCPMPILFSICQFIFQHSYNTYILFYAFKTYATFTLIFFSLLIKQLSPVQMTSTSSMQSFILLLET